MSRYEWDTNCADLELRRLQNGFTAEDHTNFAATLLRNYARTQERVHIETGSLRSSGTSEVTRSTSRQWRGEISYGGMSRGVKNPVRYAVSELFGRSPRYGGPPAHDYMLPTRFIDVEMVTEVDHFFGRGHTTPHLPSCPHEAP